MGAALLPIGAAALVAGCAGGSVSSNGTYTPPVASAGSSNRAMTTVQVTLAFGSSGSSGNRQAMALNSTVKQVGIRFIPIPAPAVTPTEQVFTIPQPAPASTTLAVQAPVGQSQFILGAYESPPNCLTSAARKPQALPSLVPLNGSVQNVTLSANGTNAISAPISPVAFGAALIVTPAPNLPSAGYLGTTQWAPFENLSVAQSATMKVVPVDVCGTQMTNTTVANSVVVSGPAGVAFSPNTFSATGNTTATFAANTNTGGTTSASATLPANTAPFNSGQAVTVTPDYYIFALDPSGSFLSVLDAAGGFAVSSANQLAHSRQPIAQNRAALRKGGRKALGFSGGATAMAAVNASSCTGGSVAAAVAVVGSLNNGSIEVFTVSPSGAVNGPAIVPWPYSAPQAVAFDAACRLYVGDGLGYLGVGSSSGITSITNVAGTYTPGVGVSALLAAPSTMYAAYGDYSNSTLTVGTVPFGGTAVTATAFGPSVTSSFASIDALALAGGNVYVASSLNPSCYVDYRSLSGASITSSPPTAMGPTIQFFGSTTGTLYALTGAGYLLSISGGNLSASAPPPFSQGGVTGMSLSLDNPTSALWLAGNSAVYQYSISGGAPTATGRSIPMSSPVPGPLSIAP
jgi:hypothetical protein